MSSKNDSLLPRRKAFFGLNDARGMRGILSRGPARYNGPAKAPNPGNIFDVQKAARRRLNKLNDTRRMR